MTAHLREGMPTQLIECQTKGCRYEGMRFRVAGQPVSVLDARGNASETHYLFSFPAMRCTACHNEPTVVPPPPLAEMAADKTVEAAWDAEYERLGAHAPQPAKTPHAEAVDEELRRRIDNELRANGLDPTSDGTRPLRDGLLVAMGGLLWQTDLPTPAVPEAVPLYHADHDHKGYSEEKCVRCGWVMGRPPLNCQNDNTPHVFPSQLGFAYVRPLIAEAPMPQPAERTVDLLDPPVPVHPLPLDLHNWAAVGRNGEGKISVGRYNFVTDVEGALILAAWLVAVADPGQMYFPAISRAVLSS